jgi:hypothetical protein
VSGEDRYYWAAGRKVPLTAASEVVIDLRSAAAAQISATALEALQANGRSLSDSLLMVSEADAVAALGEGGAAMSGVHPVFRSEDGSLVAVLPEVRVEAADSATLDELGSAAPDAHVTERTEERLVLEPDSGRGDDALTLANTLAETGRADVSQARFIRIVARPPQRHE